MGKKCADCIRILMIVFNFLFVLCGLCITAFALMIYFSSFEFHTQNSTSHIALVLYILMGAGGLTVLLGICGCCGAYHLSKCLLATYFILLLLIFAAELAAGVVGYLMRDEVVKFFDKSFKNGVEEIKENPDAMIRWMDFVQTNLKCCGTQSSIEYGDALKLPKSCCPSELCSSFVNAHNKGCSKEMEDFLDKNIPICSAIILSIAVLELIGLIFSMMLCCSLRNAIHYEAVVA